jgi:hypothetical protein
MSTTLLNALGLIASAGAGKLPAAPATRTSMGPKRATAAWKAAPRAAGSRTSAMTSRAWSLAIALRLSAAAFALSGLRPRTVTFAPAST